AAAGLAPWMAVLRRRLRRHGIRTNDIVLGLGASGAMDEATVLRLLELLPPRCVAEMYFHPATRRSPEIERTMPNYRHQDELAALTSPGFRRALERLAIRPMTFGDLVGKDITVYAAGRTDAGTHASGQVANFHTDGRISP